MTEKTSDGNAVRVFVHTAVDGYAWQGVSPALAQSLQASLDAAGTFPGSSPGRGPQAAGGVIRCSVGGVGGTAVYRYHRRIAGDFRGRDSHYAALAFFPADGDRFDLRKVWDAPAMRAPAGGDLASLFLAPGDWMAGAEARSGESGAKTLLESASVSVSGPDAPERIALAFQGPEYGAGALNCAIFGNQDGTLRGELVYEVFPEVSAAAEAEAAFSRIPAVSFAAKREKLAAWNAAVAALEAKALRLYSLPALQKIAVDARTAVDAAAGPYGRPAPAPAERPPRPAAPAPRAEKEAFRQDAFRQPDAESRRNLPRGVVEFPPPSRIAPKSWSLAEIFGVVGFVLVVAVLTTAFLWWIHPEQPEKTTPASSTQSPPLDQASSSDQSDSPGQSDQSDSPGQSDRDRLFDLQKNVNTLSSNLSPFRKWADGEFQARFDAFDQAKANLDGFSATNNLDTAQKEFDIASNAASWILTNGPLRESIDIIARNISEMDGDLASAEAEKYVPLFLKNATTARNAASILFNQGNYAEAKSKYEEAKILYSAALEGAREKKKRAEEEARKAEEERQEAERKEAERKAEAERKEAERKEAERKAAEKDAQTAVTRGNQGQTGTTNTAKSKNQTVPPKTEATATTAAAATPTTATQGNTAGAKGAVLQTSPTTGGSSGRSGQSGKSGPSAPVIPTTSPAPVSEPRVIDPVLPQNPPPGYSKKENRDLRDIAKKMVDDLGKLAPPQFVDRAFFKSANDADEKQEKLISNRTADFSGPWRTYSAVTNECAPILAKLNRARSLKDDIDGKAVPKKAESLFNAGDSDLNIVEAFIAGKNDIGRVLCLERLDSAIVRFETVDEAIKEEADRQARQKQLADDIDSLEEEINSWRNRMWSNGALYDKFKDAGFEKDDAKVERDQILEGKAFQSAAYWIRLAKKGGGSVYGKSYSAEECLKAATAWFNKAKKEVNDIIASHTATLPSGE